jgi:hypothetical protein
LKAVEVDNADASPIVPMRHISLTVVITESQTRTFNTWSPSIFRGHNEVRYSSLEEVTPLPGWVWESVWQENDWVVTNRLVNSTRQKAWKRIQRKF